MFQHHCCCHSYQWPHRGLRSLGLPQACLFSFSFWVQEAHNLDPPALPAAAAAAASSASCPLWSCSIFFFFLFHFKTQNSKKFRNPKDSVATQSLKVKTFLKVQFLHTLLANVVLFVLLSAKTSFRNCSG